MRSDESLEDALAREVREEVGVEFPSAEFFDRVVHDYGDRIVALNFFLCAEPSGTPSPCEGQELKWASWDELRDLPTPDANQRIIDRLRPYLLGGESLALASSDLRGQAPRELELKIRLGSLRDFRKLLEESTLGETVRVSRLTNDYFDTADKVLRRQRVMLRLRRSTRAVVCLKVGAEARPGYFESLEFETEVGDSAAERILEAPSELFRLAGDVSRELHARFGALDLQSLGQMTPERTTRARETLEPVSYATLKLPTTTYV